MKETGRRGGVSLAPPWISQCKGAQGPTYSEVKVWKSLNIYGGGAKPRTRGWGVGSGPCSPVQGPLHSCKELQTRKYRPAATSLEGGNHPLVAFCEGEKKNVCDPHIFTLDQPYFTESRSFGSKTSVARSHQTQTLPFCHVSTLIEIPPSIEVLAHDTRLTMWHISINFVFQSIFCCVWYTLLRKFAFISSAFWDNPNLRQVKCSGGSWISPKWGHQPSGGAPTYDVAKISQKLHEIERIWTLGQGACVPCAPLRSATEMRV